MEMHEFLIRANLQRTLLEVWIEAGWIIPDRSRESWSFRDIDLARTQLIRDLQHDFGVNDEGVPLILDLIDQMSGLRRMLGHLAEAIRSQPNDVGQRIVADIRDAVAAHTRQ